MRTLVLDLASAALPDAAMYLEGSVKAPSNYGPDAAAKYIAEKSAERLLEAALDIDCARITALGFALEPHLAPQFEHAIDVRVCRDEKDERLLIQDVADLVTGSSIITYYGHNFDLPLVMRRAMYLGLKFPKINLDRFKSPHIDLGELMSDRNPNRRRSLSFYVRRFGWNDLTKILSGAEEAQVPTTNRWDDLEASIRHDLTATYRLAQRFGVVPGGALSSSDPSLPF
jgi:DNA polymerase elongation subunit (family B)